MKYPLPKKFQVFDFDLLLGHYDHNLAFKLMKKKVNEFTTPYYLLMVSGVVLVVIYCIKIAVLSHWLCRLSIYW